MKLGFGLECLHSADTARFDADDPSPRSITNVHHSLLRNLNSTSGRLLMGSTFPGTDLVGVLLYALEARQRALKVNVCCRLSLRAL